MLYNPYCPITKGYLCSKKNCAWWDKSENKCAFQVMNQSLKRIADCVEYLQKPSVSKTTEHFKSKLKSDQS